MFWQQKFLEILDYQFKGCINVTWLNCGEWLYSANWLASSATRLLDTLVPIFPKELSLIHMRMVSPRLGIHQKAEVETLFRHIGSSWSFMVFVVVRVVW